MEMQYQRRLLNESQKSYRGILAVMIPFFAFFVIVDKMLYPPEIFFWQALIRGIIILVITFLYFRTAKKPIARLPEILMSLILGGITLFALVAKGYESPYFFGMGLTFFAATNLFSWGPKKVAMWTLGWDALYLLCVSIKAGFHFENTYALANCIAFPLGCAMVAVWGAHISDRLRREIYAQSLAVDKRDEFISIASHELKTPITALKLQLQMTRRGVDPEKDLAPSPEKLAKSMDTSIVQVDRMTSLIDEMLDHSQISSGGLNLNRVEVNLSELVSEVVDRFQPQFSLAGVAVTVKVEPGVIGAWDKERIEQVISNLFLNVIKHAPNAPLDILLKRTPDTAILRVQDSGPGIPEAFREKIFERFERGAAKLSRAGLGLGLYISRQIVLRHEGRIFVDPNCERGAIFVVELPLRLKRKGVPTK